MYLTLLRVMALALMPVVAVLFVVARPFFAVWAGPTYAEHSTFPFLILVLGVAANALGTIPGNVLMAADRVSVIARYHLLQLVPYLVVTVLMIASFGAVGAAATWGARAILTAGMYLRAANRVVSGTRPAEPRRFGFYVAAALIPGVAAGVILAASPPLVIGATVMAIALALYLVFVWSRLLSASERSLMRRVIAGIAPKAA
jgi:O-antigen/teichoic acid export membrane protein